MSRKVMSSPAPCFVAFCTQPAAQKMRRTIFIHGSVRVIALLALLLVDATHSANPQTMSNATTMKILWSDIRQFGVEGRGWNDTKDFYDRLPAKAEALVRKPVWDLSRNSAGMGWRFVTDATTLRARWALINSWLYLPNETAIGNSGLDLYVKTENGWHWLAVGQP